MRGHNKIQFNAASMIEIVQYYLDNKMLNPQEPRPKVTSVEALSSGRLDNIFEVQIETSVTE